MKFHHSLELWLDKKEQNTAMCDNKIVNENKYIFFFDDSYVEYYEMDQKLNK